MTTMDRARPLTPVARQRLKQAVSEARKAVTEPDARPGCPYETAADWMRGPLSEAQLQVLVGVAIGESQTETARRISMPVGNVTHHKRTARERLDLAADTPFADAVEAALSRGLIIDDDLAIARLGGPGLSPTGPWRRP